MPGVTVKTPGACAVAFGSFNSTSSTVTPPTGFTETGDRGTGTRAAELSYQLNMPTGATGTITLTQTGTAKSLGCLLILRPVVAECRRTVSR